MTIVKGQKVKVKWNGNTRSHYENKGYNFTFYNDFFEVNVNDLTEGASVSVKCICDTCNEPFIKIYSYISKQNKHYCSLKCSNRAKRKERIEKKCEVCNSIFEVKPSLSAQRFCSIKCQGIWQTNTRTGINASNYNKSISKDERTLKCEWCNSEFTVVPSKINTARFCSISCRQEWFAKEWSQQEEWKKECSIRAVNILEEGKISKTDSGAQIILNNILDDLEVKYINEYNCLVVSIDNYLQDYNLMIEVMGSYWHVDPRVYKKINYQTQFDRVIHDKRKNGIIQNQYNINILYIWEKDLIENPDLCRSLISYYIKCNGTLKEYNSFNYQLISGNLVLTNKYIPFMQMSSKELHGLFVPVDGKKKSYKQHDKWIVFNCDCCGIETDQLKSRYNKNKHHYCSTLCKNISQQKGNKNTLGAIVKCSNCGNEKRVTNYEFTEYTEGRKKNFFCNYKCQGEWKRKQRESLYPLP